MQCFSDLNLPNSCRPPATWNPLSMFSIFTVQWQRNHTAASQQLQVTIMIIKAVVRKHNKSRPYVAHRGIARFLEIDLKLNQVVPWSLHSPHLPWKFHANRSSRFLVILLTKKQRNKQRNRSKTIHHLRLVLDSAWYMDKFDNNYLDSLAAVYANRRIYYVIEYRCEHRRRSSVNFWGRHFCPKIHLW